MATSLPVTGSALIFDAHYDSYRGVIAYVRVMNGTLKKMEALEKKVLNDAVISAGGQWMCKRSVYNEVLKEFGYFSPPNANVEFFSLRAAARSSKKIFLIDYPMFICGRMNKSAGNTLGEINKNIFDWSFENPGWFDKANTNRNWFRTRWIWNWCSSC